MNYEPLLLGLAGETECPDEYNEESTLITPGMQRLFVQILGANGVYLQFGLMLQGRGTDEGSVVWQPAQPYMPIVASLARTYDAVRVRNFVAGQHAEVILTPLPQ